MTLLLVDGCEDYSSWLVGAGGAPTIQAGRNGNAFKMPVSASVPSLSMAIPTADQTDTITFGFAFQFSFQQSTNTIGLWSDNGATEHNRVTVNSSGLVVVTRGGTTIATATNPPITINTWNYIEGTIKLGDSPNGTASIWVNGTQYLNATSLDTKNAGTKTVYDTVILHPCPASFTDLIDDLYLTNDTTRFGDCKVETLYANGNGSTNAWLGSDGDSTDNYLLVDETGTPNTADYVSSATAGQQDLYTMTDLAATSGVIRGICHAAHIAKTDSGARQVKLLNRGSATNASAARDLGTTFVNQHWGLTINPETGSAFTIAEVNALQSGVECV